ncbi:MAG: MFS transporter [Elusimicrobia bacterium]|nr:MFS transporter [Elusimicrobiota bacterium]
MTAPSAWTANVRRVYAWKLLTSLHFFAGVLIPFFTQWGGITLRQVLWLQTWFMLWIVALEVPTGAFADRFGRRSSLFCATVCLISAVAYYVTHRGLGHFLVAEFLWACAAAFASGADEALAYDSLKAEGAEGASKAALARLGTAEIFAIAVAAPIGSMVASRWGLRAPLALGLIPFTIALPVAWSLREPPRERAEHRDYWQTLTDGARYFLGHRILRALAFDAVTIWCFSFMIIWLYQPRLQQLGMPLVWFGFVTTGMTLFQSGILLRIEAVERLVGGPRRFLTVSGLIPGLAYLCLAFAPSARLAAPLFVLVAGFGLSRAAILNNYMHKHVDSARRATVLSAAGMTRQLLTAAVYPLVGWAAEKSLSWTFAGLGTAVLVCVAASSVEEAHLLD